MSIVNHAKKEINAKIVYYGPAGSGKSTALNYIFSRIKPSLRGELKTVPAGTDNLLFFDFNPFETALPNGYRVRLHVYTLSGTVTNPATWKMTLKGADGIIIMINPAPEHAGQARDSVSDLRDFLSAYGVGLHDTPVVLQLNHFGSGVQQDQAAPIAAALELTPLATCISNAASGDGLLEALTTLSREVLDRAAVKDEIAKAEHIIPHSSEEEPPAASPGPVSPEAHPDTPSGDESPRVTLLSQEAASDGTSIRIPLEVTQGSARQRLVVTVNIALQ